MPPKKMASQPDEAEEIRRSLDFLTAEVAKISAQQTKIMNLMGEIHTLKIKNMEKDTNHATGKPSGRSRAILPHE